MGAASCRLLRLLGTTGGWTNYSSCVQQMWNMLEVGGRGKYSTHSTSRASLPSQLGPKIAVGKHSHLVFGFVEEQSWFQCQDEFWGVSRFDEENCSDLVWEIQSWGELKLLWTICSIKMSVLMGLINYEMNIVYHTTQIINIVIDQLLFCRLY